MILQALYQLAEFEQLVDDPDFEVKPVSWAIRLKSSGEFVGFEDLRTNLNEGTGRKAKYVGKPVQVPRSPIRTSGDAAFFLVDKSEYALGFDPEGKRPAEKLQVRLGLFLEQAKACFQQCGDESVKAVIRFLEANAQYQARFSAAFQESPWAPNDLFGFKVGLQPGFVHDRPEVRSFWKSIRAVPANSGEQSLQCLVTGESFQESGLFPLLKRVPGGTSSGVSLVSFNANAFESFGFSGNENAPISRAAAEQTATALNRLLHESFPDPRDPNAALPGRHIRIGGDTIVCFWSCTPQQDSQEFISYMPALFRSESENTVREVYRSLWRGREISLDDPSQFYVLILSGAQGRAVVRDWIVTTLSETQQHLAQHFADLNIKRTAAAKKGESWTSPIPLEWLMKSLAPEGKGDAIPASLEAGFVRAAFTGMAYPFQILQRALVRARAEAGRSEWIDAARRDARAALIRGVLNRRRRTDADASHRYPEVPVAMSPNLESEGHALGLLMAVLERLQVAALGNVNASVIDRYFSAASATPRSVFVRLLKNARHHARKALDSDEPVDRALASRLDRIIDVLCDRFDLNRRQFPPQRCGLPAHLDLEQQGLFVLGYHQMRHWLWLSNDERRAWEQDHPDVPAAFRWLKSEPAAA